MIGQVRRHAIQLDNVRVLHRLEGAELVAQQLRDRIALRRTEHLEALRRHVLLHAAHTEYLAKRSLAHHLEPFNLVRMEVPLRRSDRTALACPCEEQLSELLLNAELHQRVGPRAEDGIDCLRPSAHARWADVHEGLVRVRREELKEVGGELSLKRGCGWRERGGWRERTTQRVAALHAAET